jgi:hypothetical protein
VCCQYKIRPPKAYMSALSQNGAWPSFICPSFFRRETRVAADAVN